MNVFADEWEEVYPQVDGWRANYRRLAPPGNRLGMMLYELLPQQTQCPYHFHHGNEELLVVLRGRPTLRTPDGERTLDESESVYFPVGADGAHGLRNETETPVRYLMASTLSSPEVVEYPDLRQVTAQARTPSLTGERLWLIHDVEPETEA